MTMYRRQHMTSAPNDPSGSHNWCAFGKLEIFALGSELQMACLRESSIFLCLESHLPFSWIGRGNFSRRGQDMKKYVHNFFNLLDIYIQEQLVAHEKLLAELN